MQPGLGDVGHDYSGERQDEWDLVKAQMNDFIDHHLRPDRTPTPPSFDVGATVTRCLEKDAPVRYETAPDWHDLHPHHIRFTSDAGVQSFYWVDQGYGYALSGKLPRQGLLVLAEAVYRQL